jgi:anti-sigma B factor antagonist
MTPRAHGIPGFYLAHEQAEGVPVVRVGGELDLHAAPELRGAFDELMEKDVRALLLDLTDVTFIDSTALGAIVGAHKRLEPEGRMGVVCTNEHVLRIFGYAGIDELLSIHETREAALEDVRKV